MNMVYHIMNRDLEVATASFTKETDGRYTNFSYKKLIPDGVKSPIRGEVTFRRFFDFLCTRTYEDNRADIKEILESAGMTENNPYEWVEKTHGVTYEDYWWIRVNDDNTPWDEVKVRD